MEKAFSNSGKAEWRTHSAHFLLISWLMITMTFRCGLMRMSDMNDELLANIMTCNAISFVSRLTHKCFRWKFWVLFGDVCSLNVCFWLHLFGLLCCIMLCESSECFLVPPGTKHYTHESPKCKYTRTYYCVFYKQIYAVNKKWRSHHSSRQASIQPQHSNSFTLFIFIVGLFRQNLSTRQHKNTVLPLPHL